MAVVKIKILSVIGRLSELDGVTAALGKSGIFHPDNAMSFYSDTSEFLPLNEENPYSEALHTLEDTMKSLGRKVDLLGIPDVEKIAPDIGDWRSYVKELSCSVKKLLEERNGYDRQIAEDSGEIEKVSHFVGLKLDLDGLRECKFIKTRFGSLPKESYQKLLEYKQNPYVLFFPGSLEGEQLWGVYCAPVDRIAEVDRIFSGLYFERIHLNRLSGTTESAMTDLLKKREEETRRRAEASRRIDELWEKERRTVRKIYSWLSEKYVFFNIRRYAARYGDNFILTGWVPADRVSEVRSGLSRFESVKCTFDSAEEPKALMHSPPVKLKNKKLFRPFEYYVGIYGLPSYNEVDPTVLVAVTYTILFGIMFADLGQGLCISLVGVYMWKKRGMELGRVLVPCGISSSLFGLALGSVFGFEHALDPLYRGMFGLPGKPIAVMDPATTNQIIYFAVALGICLVIVAILMNIYSSLRRKNYTNGLFGPNGFAGLIFYCAVVFGFGGQLLFGWKLVGAPYVVCLIVLPAAVMFFREILGGLAEGRSDWKPESWGDFVMQNFFEVFEFLLPDKYGELHPRWRVRAGPRRNDDGRVHAGRDVLRSRIRADHRVGQRVCHGARGAPGRDSGPEARIL